MKEQIKTKSDSDEALEQEEELESNSDNQLVTNNVDNDDEDEMDLANFNADAVKRKKRKKGIIYISNIPKHMNVTRLREILADFGKIGRVYLQPEKQPGSGKDKATKKKKHKRLNLNFTEGWVEFESKRVAKQIVPLLNNKQISTRKKSQFYDSLWSMKYLPRFKWIHLTERMNYEQATHRQRLQTEVSQARRETTFFQNNLDRSEHIKKLAKKAKKMKTSGDNS
ncbi:pre-rRNA-processing protein esf2 [Drosophila grimshawi]|uniref:Activator of basal transcription 1 n=1 Tax=Drosophila grimshawi TaxID=7222 RepID=B4JMI9_DROGR|nr:pre-rRNA-processing protein esf2 [Drosophila grimshawi]EDV91932.1 GH24320 [Drosophila grimshawi]